MAEVAIKLPKDKLIEGLSMLPFKEIKEIMDCLIRKKLLAPPSAKSIYEKALEITKKKRLPAQVAEEAVRWAGAKK